MADFPTLMMKADTRGLEKGEKALDRVAGAAEKTETATDSMSDSVERSGQTFEQLRASIDPAYAASQRYGEVQRTVAGMVKSGEASQRAANIVLQEAARKYLGVVPAAEASAQAQKKSAEATQAARRSYESIRASLDPLYASSKQYEAVLDETSAALKLKAISQGEANKLLSLAEKQYLSSGNAAMAYGRHVSVAKHHTANLAFQLNDIGMMMAAGQNPFILAMQQGTQVSQVLNQMGGGVNSIRAVGQAFLQVINPTSLVTLGLIAGAAALGQWAMSAWSAEGDTKAFEDSLGDLAKMVSRYKEYTDLASTSTADLEKRFGSAGSSASTIAEFMAQFERIDAVQRLNKEVALLTERFGGLDVHLTVLTKSGHYMKEIEETYFNLRSQLELTEDQALIVLSALEQLSKADSPQATVEAAETLWRNFEGAFGAVEKIPTPLLEAAKNAGLLAFEAGEILDLAERQAMLLEQQRQTAGEMIAKYEAQAAMANTIATFGKDSAQVEALKRAEAQATAEAFIQQENLSGAVAQSVRDAAQGAYEAEVNSANAANALRDAEAAAKGLASAMAAAAGYSLSLDQGVRILEAEISALQAGADAAIASQIEQKRIRSENMRDAQVAAGVDLVIADAQHAIDLATIDRQSQLLLQKKALTAEAKRSGSANKAAANSSLAALKAEIAQRTVILGMTKKQRREYEAVLGVTKRLGKEASSTSKAQITALAGQLVALENHEQALQRINQLQGQWSEQITRTAFESGNMGDVVEGILRDIAYQFANAKIFLPVVALITGVLGLDQLITGQVGTAAVGSAAAGGGLINGLLGGVLGGGGAIGGFTSGLAGIFSGGGLGASFANLGGLLTGSVGGLGALGAAIPAIGLVGLAISALIGKTKVLNSGLRITVDEFDALIQSFVSKRKSRLFGLIKKDWTEVADLSVEDAAPILQALSAVQTGILDMAGLLSVEPNIFEDFSTTVDVSLQGLSDEEKAKAIQDALAGIGDEMAEIVLAGHDVIQTGETASEALTRLSTSLASVEKVVDTLGHSFDATGIAGGDVASGLVSWFGGLDALNGAASTYHATMYSEAERTATATRQVQEQLAALNVIMPATREQYRLLVEAQDLTTERGQEVYATLLSLAGVFDQVLPSVASFSSQMAGLVGSANTVIDSMIATASDAARASETAANDWYRTSTTLRDLIHDMVNASSSSFSLSQRYSSNSAALNAAFVAARGGDIDAAREFSGLAKDYLSSARSKASTAAEYRLIEATVRGQASFLAGLSELEGANKDVMRTLAEQQVATLTDLKTYLMGADAIEEETIASFEAQLGSLQTAIQEAEMFSYAYLKERLKVTVDLLPTADLPADVARLLTTAADGIESSIEFAVRADGLTPDLRWLALNASSEHIKTFDFLVGEELDAETARLALLSSSALNRTVNLLTGESLPADQMRVALAGSSELSRVVNVALSSSADHEAIQLALGNVGSYAVSVRAALDGSVSDDVRQVVFEGSGSYAAMVEAAFSTNLSEDVRRVLLERQGLHAVNVHATLADDIPNNVRSLLLDASTSAVRGITVAMAFSDTLSTFDRLLLTTQSVETLHTINGAVNLSGISSRGLTYLDELVVGNWQHYREIIAGVVVSGVIGRGADFMDLLSDGQWQHYRGIFASISMDGLGPSAWRYFNELVYGQEKRLRAIGAEVDFSALNGGGWSYYSELRDGASVRTRGLRAGVFLGGLSGTEWNFYNELRSGSWERTRRIVAGVNVGHLQGVAVDFLNMISGDRWRFWREIGAGINTEGISGVGHDFLDQVIRGTTSIARIISGHVDLSGLNDQQLSLLDMINGATSGYVTLGGSFSFDPSTAFENWFGSTTENNITAPMATLTDALNSVRDELRMQQFRDYASGLTNDFIGKTLVNDQQIARLAELGGIDTTGMSRGQTMWAISELSNTDALERLHYDPNGYWADRLAQATRPEYTRGDFQLTRGIDGNDFRVSLRGPMGGVQEMWLQEAYNLIDGIIGGDIPAFANGGVHSGGIRLVGERGPELEATGPSRIYNASQTRDILAGGGEEQAKLLWEVLATLKELVEQGEQLGSKDTANIQRMSRLFRKWDKDGMPEERTA